VSSGADRDARRALLRARVRDIPDFPKPGILFRDLTPLMGDGPAMREAVDMLSEAAVRHRPELIVAIESRGFIFGAPLAIELGVGFVPIRKIGKLPAEKIFREYALEYGTATLEVHVDAVQPGQRVLLIDDLLATGGTAGASAALLEALGAEVVSVAFLIELTFLDGRAALPGHDVYSILQY